MNYVVIIFGLKKLSKHINMGYSIEDLVMTTVTIKTLRQSEKRFVLDSTHIIHRVGNLHTIL